MWFQIKLFHMLTLVLLVRHLLELDCFCNLNKLIFIKLTLINFNFFCVCVRSCSKKSICFLDT